MQFHTWDDGWSYKEEWQRVIEDLKKEGNSRYGHQYEPMGTRKWDQSLETGLIDAVQVIYNMADQAPRSIVSFLYSQ